MIYSSVVSRESVRIAFTVAALNDLDVVMSEVGNAFLNAKTSEKVYGIAGIEFGDQDVGKVCVIVRVLYGLKSSGAAWCSRFAFRKRPTTYGIPVDVSGYGHMAPASDKEMWFQVAYYEYILVYVDDQPTISGNAMEITNQLITDYKYGLKDVGPPIKYVGAKVCKHTLADGSEAWYMSAEEYLKKTIPEIEQKFGNIANLAIQQVDPRHAGTNGFSSRVRPICIPRRR